MPRSTTTLLAFLSTAAMLFLPPVATHAQQTKKVYQIGYLHQNIRGSKRLAHFRQGLREAGYVEGRDIIVHYRFAEGRRDRLANLAGDLVALKLAVIVGATTPAALALKRATTTIPIVMVAGSDPVAQGLVGSLQRPGGNITGLTRFSGRLSVKRLEILKEAFPNIRRVGVLRGAGRGEPIYFKEMQATAQSLGIDLQGVLNIRPADDLESVFKQVAMNRVDALITLPSSIFGNVRKRIVGFTIRNRLPAMFDTRGFVKAGGLMSYQANVPDIMRRAAFYVDKILKGDNPADMPVERPTKFDFVINLKTAKALSLTLPPSILLQATEVIE